MSLSKQLIELQQTFQAYQPLWNEWSNTKDCALNEDDKDILSVHAQNNFKLANDNLFMFYNQFKQISGLTDKLQNGYSELQEWAILKFQFAIVKIASKIGWSYTYYMDISGLEIPKELKTVLLKFNCRSINELSERHTDVGFKESKLFKIVIEFLTLEKKINTVNNVLKKEVA
jgi:hypothetical protein